MTHHIFLPQIKAPKPETKLITGPGIGVPLFESVYRWPFWKEAGVEWGYNWGPYARDTRFGAFADDAFRMAYSSGDSHKDALKKAKKEPWLETLFLNEPEDKGQANVLPHIGAAMAREYARNGLPYAGPNVQVTTQKGRYWLARFMSELAPSEWPTTLAIHLYATDPFWSGALLDFKEWMAGFPWGNLPVIITETNNIAQSQRDQWRVMEQCFRAMDAGLIRAFAWFAECCEPVAGAEDGWPWSWLFDRDGQITQAGRAFLSMLKGTRK